MDIFSLLTMIGGLALFLYGMQTMGDGLVRFSGGKLEKILERLTRKRIMAVLLGAMVTAVIQSSSATTVMVVGFVNSGIMKLGQAVGIIMGANIGTTITSWILSLAGLDGSNILIRLLKPSSFSPILAAIGIIFVMTGKEGSGKRTLGTIFLGFAVLMFGMETMSGAVAPLKENASFTGILTAFSNPILGMIAGTVLTAVIQSSSASVGILQALCLSGAVTYGTAFPIIMGQNIGTCVTALLSSVGAAGNAKRAAFIHLYFNLIGTIICMTGFYTLNHFLHFSFLANSAGAAGIALIHSIFNIGCTVLLFPFAGLLVKLAERTIPNVETTKEPVQTIPSLTALDERFLDRSSFAIQLCRNAVEEMAEHSAQAIYLAMDANNTYSDEKIREVMRLEKLCDEFEDTIGSYLLKLAGRDLSHEDSHLLSLLLHAIRDFERISDHAVNIAEAAEKMHAQHLEITEQGKKELASLGRAVEDIVKLTTEIFIQGDFQRASEVEPMEEVIDDLVMEMKQRHIERLRKGICDVDAGLLLEDILTNYERVSDHCSNIAVVQIKIREDEMDMHHYLDVTVRESDPYFRSEYLRRKQVYILP